MAKKNEGIALQLVLAHEGGYVNNPKDPGGVTNRGITQKVYDAYRKSKNLANRTVKLLEAGEIFEIYDRQYWDLAKCDDLPAGVDYCVFDYSVNSGVSRAIKDLQRTLNQNANVFGISGQIAVDGVIGVGTLAAVKHACEANEIVLIADYCDRRMTFLRQLRTYSTFGKGWKRRVMGDIDGYSVGDSGVVDYAVKMATDDLTFSPMSKPIPGAIGEKAAVHVDLLPAKSLPTAIGEKKGEVAGKAPESKQALLKTVRGIGMTISGSGLSGTSVYSWAQQVQPHIGDTLLGKAALAVFIGLGAMGLGLMGLDWYKKQQEKAVQD